MQKGCVCDCGTPWTFPLLFVQFKVSLQKLQNETVRIVTGLTLSVSLDNLYRKCGWMTLAGRHRQQNVIVMFKSVNGLVPSYISYIIPPPVRETNPNVLRNQNNITVSFCRTEIFIYPILFYSMDLSILTYVTHYPLQGLNTS